MTTPNRNITLRGLPLLAVILVCIVLPSFAAGLVCGILVAS